ncbi:MAG: TIM barrel protein [Gemmataceae bacterium]
MRHPDRRTMLASSAAALGTLAAGDLFADEVAKPKGNINQSLCRWCYGKIKLDELAEKSKAMGYKSVELLKPDEVLTVKKFGMTCAVLNGGPSIGIGNCLNRPENHEKNVKDLKASIDFAAAEGVPNVICFSGNRKGMPDDVGLKNCAEGLKKVVGYAEEKKVTLVMELLNSKVDHKDYMCDRTAWGVELCKTVGSPRFKLLYDIYHMQIMEGDVIRTLRQNKEWIGHYHTGGNPGRNEIDETQELNYPAIMKAILATGYAGYVAQEFIPKRDPLTSLAQGFKICDV